MDFLVVNGFDVTPGKNVEFQKWAQANTQALNESTPDGISLVGVYATMFGSEKESGQYKSVWRMTSYGDMDKFAAAAGEGGEFGRLLDEMGSFGDFRIGANWSSELLKSVSDITIWADNPEE